MFVLMLLSVVALADDDSTPCPTVDPAPVVSEPAPEPTSKVWTPGGVCKFWSYRRPNGSCSDLFRCSEDGRIWLQTRSPAGPLFQHPTPGRGIPAPRIPAAGCDLSDLACIDTAEKTAVQWACRP